MEGVYRVATDGAARGNPGPAGFGVVLTDPLGNVVAEDSGYLGEATNNVAEYRGLLAGLELAIKKGANRLIVAMDSTLVVQQMRGTFKVKNPGLKQLHTLARELVEHFEAVRFEAVPREDNSEADALANQAIDAGGEMTHPAGPSQSELF